MDEELIIRLLVAYDRFLSSDDFRVSVDNPGWLQLAEQFDELRHSMTDEQMDLWYRLTLRGI